MKRNTTRFALLAGACAAGLALSACDDEPTQAEKTPKTGDQLAADNTKPETTAPERAETEQPRTDKAPADTAPETPGTDGGATRFQATLKSMDGREMGTLEVVQGEGKEVVVRFEGRNLPAGDHAIHFHEKGLCEGPTFKSAGDHWRPANWDERGANKGVDPGHLGTVRADDKGNAVATFANAYASLKKAAPNTLFDRDGVSVVIHAKPDMNAARPGGEAGDRLACAVIEPQGMAPQEAPKN